MMKQISRLPPIDETRAALIKGHGARITPLEPIGAQVSGLDLTAREAPPPEVVTALE